MLDALCPTHLRAAIQLSSKAAAGQLRRIPLVPSFPPVSSSPSGHGLTKNGIKGKIRTIRRIAHQVAMPDARRPTLDAAKSKDPINTGKSQQISSGESLWSLPVSMLDALCSTHTRAEIQQPGITAADQLRRIPLVSSFPPVPSSPSGHGHSREMV